MPHSELHQIKTIPVFVVLALCTIKIYHIRARAIDHSVLFQKIFRMTMTLKNALSIYFYPIQHTGEGGGPHLIGLNAHNLVTDHLWSVNSCSSVMVTLKKILHSTLFDGPLKSEVSFLQIVNLEIFQFSST